MKMEHQTSVVRLHIDGAAFTGGRQFHGYGEALDAVRRLDVELAEHFPNDRAWTEIVEVPLSRPRAAHVRSSR